MSLINLIICQPSPPFSTPFPSRPSARHHGDDLPPLRCQVPRHRGLATDRGADDDGVQAVLVALPAAGGKNAGKKPGR